MQTPTSQMTAAQLHEEGVKAFIAGEEIIAASNGRNLDGLPLLFFEAGYFAQIGGQSVVCTHPIFTNRP